MPSSEASNPSIENERHKQLDRDIREMVTSITNRVDNFHKLGHYKDDEDDDDGVRIITLAGTNDGATLKSEVDNKPADHHSGEKPEEEALSTHVNSNFQALNNSIVFSGSYQANDPGVSIEISDFTEPTSHHKDGKHEKKSKKKEKEESKSDHGDHHHHHHHSGHSG
ncbi:uncharacterized protein LOC129287295 [Prosopis cineraria]|uniref:uncharacterized protein LOC129287295 n=1 Tax=Prosopis cineraria TaxID=364024 RepID=UPI00240F19CC|nr:uncharacterized protein LOC129287295 [Prosopis cineraria]